MVNAQQSTIQQQVETQRQSFSQQQQQLGQAQQQATQRPQTELRGQPQRGSRIGRVVSALKRRLMRKKDVGQYIEAGQQVVGQAQSFEQEVAEKAPEYGKEKYVQKEYQEAVSKLEPKISSLKKRIENARQRADKYSGDKADKYDTKAEALTEELQTLQSYLGNPVKAIKGVNTGRAFQEAKFESSKVYAKARAKTSANIQAKEMGFKSYGEYVRLKPTLQKLQSGTATQSDIAKLPASIQSKITYEEISAESLPGVTSQAAAPSGSYERLMQDIGYEGTTTKFGTTYKPTASIKPQDIGSFEKVYNYVAPKVTKVASTAISLVSPITGRIITDKSAREGISTAVGGIASMPLIHADSFATDTDIGAVKRFGSRVGDIIEQPSKLKDFLIKKEKPDVVYDLTTGVARLSTEKDYGGRVVVDPSTVKKLKPMTVGEASKEVGSYSFDLARGTGGIVLKEGKAAYEMAGDVASPIMEFASPVTGAIINIPLIRGGTEYKQLKDPYKLRGTITPEVEQSIYDTKIMERVTVGETLLGAKEGSQEVADYIGGVTKGGWDDISGRSFKYAEGQEGNIKDLATLGGYAAKGAGMFSSLVTQASPTIAQYSALGPIAGPSVDLLAIEQKKEDLSKYVKLEEDRVYAQYKKDYQKQKENLEEGYTMEPMLSKAEVSKEEGIYEKVKRDIGRESIMPLTFLAGATAFKTYGAGKKFFVDKIKFKTPTGFRITTRAKELWGTKVKLSMADDTLGIKTTYTSPKTGRYFIKEKIRKPLANLKSSEVVGFDKGKKIVFTKKQIEQYSTAGQRTRVIDVGDDFLFWKGKNKILYEGVPYKDPSGYKLQKGYLKDIFGEKYAKDVLRYTAPTIKKQYVEGALKLKKNIAGGKFISSLEQPVQVLDDALGIKTRGGKTLKEAETVFRKAKGRVGSEVSTTLIWEQGGKKVNIKGFNVKGGLTYSESSGIEKGFALKESKGGFNLFKEVDVERIGGVSIKTYLPKDGKVFVDTSKTTLIKVADKADDALSIVGKSDDTLSIVGGGKKSSKQYVKQLYAPELKTFNAKSLITKPKPIPSPKPIPDLKVITKDASAKVYPLMVGGKGGLESEYVGTGLYEVTEATGIPKSITGDVIITSDLDLVKTKTDSKYSTLELGLELEAKTRGRYKLKEGILSLGLELDMPQKMKSLPSLTQVYEPRLLERQAVKVAQKLLEITKTASTSITTTISPTITMGLGRGYGRPQPRPKPKTTRIIIPPILGGSKRIKRSVVRGKRKSLGYVATTKRYGKEVIIAKGKDLGRIISIGKKRVRRTLGATLKVKTTKGKQIKLTPGKEFRKSKMDHLAIVQRKTKRLMSLGERREIKQARGKPFSLN